MRLYRCYIYICVQKSKYYTAYSGCEQDGWGWNEWRHTHIYSSLTINLNALLTIEQLLLRFSFSLAVLADYEQRLYSLLNTIYSPFNAFCVEKIAHAFSKIYTYYNIAHTHTVLIYWMLYVHHLPRVITGTASSSSPLYSDAFFKSHPYSRTLSSVDGRSVPRF